MQTEMFPDAVQRPKRTDKAIIAAVFRDLASAIESWSPLGGPMTESDIEELIDELEFDIDGGDGYEMARKMERLGYVPDSRLVDILEDASFDVSRIHTQKEREWVAATGRQPKLTIGQSVTYQNPTEQYMGVISDIRYDTGHYLVSVPALGHDVKARHGFVCAWEDIEAAHEGQQKSILKAIFKT